MVGEADAALEVDVASSSLRDRPHNEHDTGSAETDDLQRANQTEPVVNTNVSVEPSLDRRIFRTDSCPNDRFGLELT